MGCLEGGGGGRGEWAVWRGMREGGEHVEAERPEEREVSNQLALVKIERDPLNDLPCTHVIQPH